jgi:hypothetical protein
MLGFFGAVVGSVGLVVLMEALDSRVRGVDALASIMKIQPIATIPYITNLAEIKRKKHIVSYTFFVTLVIIAVILLGVHIFVEPLNELTTKLIARF